MIDDPFQGSLITRAFARRIAAVATWLVAATAATTASAQVSITGQSTLAGSLVSVGEGVLVLRDDAGVRHDLKFHPPGARGAMLSTGTLLRFPGDFVVRGSYPADSLERGQLVRFEARVNKRGESEGAIEEILRVSGRAGGAPEDAAAPIAPEEEPADAKAYVPATVTGEFQRLSRGRLVVKLGRNGFTRKKSLTVTLAEGCAVESLSNDPRTAAAGARVEAARVADLSTGDRLVSRLRITIGADSAAAETFDDELSKKYRRYSDEPVAPRTIRSRHFLFQSDISERESKILLDKLETMVGLLSDYFGRQPTGLVRGYLVRDLSAWPAGALPEPQGVAKIREGAGICFSRRLGAKAEAVVYAAANHGVVQHECTHAFCTMTFGSTGPTWLSEGVAEMGQYWRADDATVLLPPGVLGYLQSADPKKTLDEIALPGRSPVGDGRDYAWRWVLCHLLANNPNYADRFKPMAIGLMTGRQGVSFAAVYGPSKPKITFEYDRFVANLENGYDCRLTGWPWDAKFAALRPSRALKTKVSARAGWQASGVRLTAGQEYQARATGEWRLAPKDQPLAADGDPDGRGRLVAAVLQGGELGPYTLSEPFELGADAGFTAPAAGDLYLRCRESWGALGDNTGEVTVAIRRAP